MTAPSNDLDASRPGDDNQGLTRSHLRWLVAASAITVAGSQPAVLTGALGVRITSALQLSGSSLGLALGTSALVIGLASLGTGRLADRVGWRRSLFLATVCSTASLLGVATLARSFLALAAFLALGAIAFAVAMPASNMMLAREMPTVRLGLSMGIKQTAGSISTLFAGLAVPLLALRVGWRYVFVTATLFPTIALLAGCGPHQTSWSRTWRRGSTRRSMPVTSRRWILLTGAFGMVMSNAVSGFLVLTLVEAGIREALAAMTFAAGSLGSLTLQVGSGWLADRHSGDGLEGVAWLLAIAAVGALLLASGHPTLGLLGGFVAFSAGRGWQALYFFAVVRSNEARPGAATGYVVVGMAAGAALGPALFGILSDHLGYGWAWVLVALVTLAGTVSSGAAVRFGRRPAARPPSDDGRWGLWVG